MADFYVAEVIRKDSATFGQHVSVGLSAVNHRMLWLPEGCAHVFVALKEDTHFRYKITDYYIV